MFDNMTEDYARQKNLVIAEGKTKIIAHRENDDGNVDIISKNDITAGNGAKHDIMSGKAAFATETTCNVFRLLKSCGIPVAFNEQVNTTTFSAAHCAMLPYEVVIRREAHGSYLKRNPGLQKGYCLHVLLAEFFLKTNGKKWKEHNLICDDPLMIYNREMRKICLYDPSKPIDLEKPFLVLAEDEVFIETYEGELSELFETMTGIAKRTFLILEKAWQIEGRTLADFKVEFGLTENGTLLLADVIDNDSWRVVEEGGKYIDKQAYRDGGTLDEMTEKYRRVAEITGRFGMPSQKIIIWWDKSEEEVSSVRKELDKAWESWPEKSAARAKPVVESMQLYIHPTVYERQWLRGIQDIAIISCGDSRTSENRIRLPLATTIPIIHLYEPSKEEEVSIAARTALGILALHNPFLYMILREQVEKDLVK